MSYNNPQGRIEGFEVDLREGRLTGTFDISEDDDRDLALDRVVVMVVAARSTKIEHQISDNGDVKARRVLKVSDAMPLTGKLREEAIVMLSSHIDPDQMTISWGTTPPPAALPTNVDEETGEIEPEPEGAGVIPPDDDFVPAPIVDRRPPIDAGVPEVVGAVRVGRRDSTLDRFLHGEDR